MITQSFLEGRSAYTFVDFHSVATEITCQFGRIQNVLVQTGLAKWTFSVAWAATGSFIFLFRIEDRRLEDLLVVLVYLAFHAR